MNQEIKILTQDEIDEKLMHLPGWRFENDTISKEFEFATFMDGINLINELATFCNTIDHHPDIHIYFKKIKFDLHRFDIGSKVTNKDIQVAAEIERLFSAYERNLAH